MLQGSIYLLVVSFDNKVSGHEGGTARFNSEAAVLLGASNLCLVVPKLPVTTGEELIGYIGQIWSEVTCNRNTLVLLSLSPFVCSRNGHDCAYAIAPLRICSRGSNNVPFPQLSPRPVSSVFGKPSSVA